jgi:F0F1-type ATP synthase assembly protein I
LPRKKAKPNGGWGSSSSGWEWITFYLLGGVFLGTLCGFGLDYLLSTTPLFLIVGIFAGFALGLYGVYERVK